MVKDVRMALYKGVSIIFTATQVQTSNKCDLAEYRMQILILFTYVSYIGIVAVFPKIISTFINWLCLLLPFMDIHAYAL